MYTTVGDDNHYLSEADQQSLFQLPDKTLPGGLMPDPNYVIM